MTKPEIRNYLREAVSFRGASGPGGGLPDLLRFRV